MNLNRRHFNAGLASVLAASTVWGGRAFAQGEPIRIGLISSISGFAQAYGQANQLGAQIAADRINAAGGIGGRQVEIVVRDDAAKTEGTIAAYRELAADGVKYFIAGPISASAAALAPLLAGTDNLLVAAGPNVLSITHELFNPNVFRVQLTPIPVFTGLAQEITRRQPEFKKWVVISSDQQANIDLANVFTNGLKKYHAEAGSDVVIHDVVLTKAGAGDFRSQITQLMSLDADGVFNGLVGSDSITFYKQARAFGLDKKYGIFADVGVDVQLVKTLGGEIPANIWSPAYWHPQDDPNPVSAEVFEAVKAKTGDQYPFGFIGLAFDAVLAIATAVGAAGSDDVDAVRTALENGGPAGATGQIVFRKEDHAYLGEMTFINFGSDAAAPEGWSMKEVVRVPSANLMEPPTPGEKYTIG